MQTTSNKRQAIVALGLVAIGAVIGLYIVFSQPQPAADNGDVGASHAAGAGEHIEQVTLTAQQIRSAGIVVEPARAAEIRRSSTMSGEIHFNGDRTAHVVPRLAGVVESVHADLGQRVKQGQVLAVIASSALAEQRSELLVAQKKLALATTIFQREKTLWEDRISAEQDYLQARLAMQEADIAQQNARQKLSALGAAATPDARHGALNTYQLRAPFDGVIVEKHLALGEAIKEDTPIFTVADLATVWADIAVPANELERVRVGAAVTVTAVASATTAAGTVSYVGALLGEQTRTAPARVVLANPDGTWRPGLFVTVAIAASPLRAAVAVPADAIVQVDDKPAVFVRGKAGFEVRPVVPGASDGTLTEVVSGLNAGSPYVAKGSFVLKAELGKSSAEHAH